MDKRSCRRSCITRGACCADPRHLPRQPFVCFIVFTFVLVVTKFVPGEHAVDHGRPVYSGDPGSDDSVGRWKSAQSKATESTEQWTANATRLLTAQLGHFGISLSQEQREGKERYLKPVVPVC